MNHRPLEVVLDVDGVLADFEGYFCEKFGDEHRELVGLEKRYPSQRESIMRFVNSPETYRYLDALQVGLDIAQFLSYEDVDLHIVTSRPMLTHRVTQEWLRRFHVPFTTLSTKRDKVAFIRALKPILAVDDIISVATDLHQSDIPTILVRHPWNDTPFFPRIRTIEEFKYEYERVVEQIPVRERR